MTPGLGSGEPALRRRLASTSALLWSASPTAVAGLLVTTILSGLLPVALAWLTKLLIDRIAEQADMVRISPLAGALAVGVLAAGALPFTISFLQGLVSRRAGLLIQDRLFAAINRLPGLELFERPDFHDHLQLAQEAADTAPQRIIRGASSLTGGALTVGGFVVTLAAIDARLAALVLVSAVPNVVAELKLSRWRSEVMWTLSSVQRRRLFFSSVQIDERAAKELRVFGLGDFLRGRMVRELGTIAEAETARDRRELAVQSRLSCLAAVVAAAGLVLAVAQAAAGRLTVGDISVVIAAIAALQTSLAASVRELAQIHEALLLLGHYEVVLRCDASQRPVRPLRSMRRQPAAIELRDVWFRYDAGQPWVLRGVSLQIRPGSSVALVGLNGAGKSTIVKLLCRFFEPDRGQILWEGVDAREVPVHELRRRIGAVFQDFMAYDLSARENIALGDLTKGFQHSFVERAARHAGIHDALSSLPRGYDTLLTRVLLDPGEDGSDPDRGVLLSGGQWQRLAVARAFVRTSCDLLILDEPSSGLDAEAEHAIHDRLRTLRQGRTSILISHRLSTVRDADDIVVLGGGQVVEQGTHSELLARGGAYARLFELQASGYRPTQAGGLALAGRLGAVAQHGWADE